MKNFFLLSFFILSFNLFSDEILVNSKGEKLLIKDNGTWELLNTKRKLIKLRKDAELEKKGDLYYAPFEEQPFSGIVEYYDSDNKIIMKKNLKDGLLEGEFILYYKNGKINLMSNYKNNLLDGEYKIFDGNEKLIKHFIYKNGNLEKEILGSNESKNIQLESLLEEDKKIYKSENEDDEYEYIDYE